MDIDALVMTAAAHHSLYADGAETFAGPLPGVQLSGVTFPDADDAQRFAQACMRDGIPARAYGATAVVLHD
jgi:hypothetical protein